MAEDWGRLVERRLGALETRGAVEDVHRANVEGRLSAIEDSLKWLVRLIIGTLVTGALAYGLGGAWL